VLSDEEFATAKQKLLGRLSAASQLPDSADGVTCSLLEKGRGRDIESGNILADYTFWLLCWWYAARQAAGTYSGCRSHAQ